MKNDETRDTCVILEPKRGPTLAPVRTFPAKTITSDGREKGFQTIERTCRRIPKQVHGCTMHART